MNKKHINPKKPEKKEVQVIKEKTWLEKLWATIDNANGKIIFFISLGIIFLLCLYMASLTSLNCDAPIDYENGKKSLDFYLSAGKDTSCLDLSINNRSYAHNKYYGSGFEATYSAIERVFKLDNVYQLRMYYLCVWGIVLLFFMALIGKEVAGWKGAVLALWLSFLTPFLLGQFFWNTKDIPHALGFAIAIYYMIRFFRKLPKISIRDAIGIAVGIMVAVSIRIGGLLVVCYWGLFLLLSCLKPSMRELFTKKRWNQLLKIAGVGVIVAVAGALVGLLFYPNFWVHGISHITESFGTMSKFFLRTPFVFEGERILSTELPWYYLPKSFIITTPIFYLILLLIAIPLTIIKRKKLGMLNVALLWFTFIFPFAYSMYIHAVLYNGWRHILFAYVTVPAMMTFVILSLLEEIKKIPLKLVTLMTVLGCMVYLFIWNIKNAPYQAAYYNQLVGGSSGAYERYDFDVVHFAAAVAGDKLLKTLSPADYSEERPLVIAMTNEIICNYFYVPDEWNNKVKIDQLSYKGYAGTECDYAILSLQFSTPLIRKSFFPPKGTISEELVDDVPVACVVDRREDADYRGIKLLQQNKMEEGMEFLEKAYAYNPKNFPLYFWMGYGYYGTGNYAKSIEMLNKYNRFYPNDKDTQRLLGYSYYGEKQYDNAFNAFNKYYAMEPSDLNVAYMMGVCLYEKKNYNSAKRFLQQIVDRNPNFTEARNLLNHIQSL